jgi:hypothetical protein
LELLAYMEIGALAYLSDEGAIGDAVSANLPTSQFRRVWIYEALMRRVPLSFTIGEPVRED